MRIVVDVVVGIASDIAVRYRFYLFHIVIFIRTARAYRCLIPQSAVIRNYFRSDKRIHRVRRHVAGVELIGIAYKRSVFIIPMPFHLRIFKKRILILKPVLYAVPQPAVPYVTVSCMGGDILAYTVRAFPSLALNV